MWGSCLPAHNTVCAYICGPAEQLWAAPGLWMWASVHTSCGQLGAALLSRRAAHLLHCDASETLARQPAATLGCTSWANWVVLLQLPMVYDVMARWSGWCVSTYLQHVACALCLFRRGTTAWRVCCDSGLAFHTCLTHQLVGSTGSRACAYRRPPEGMHRQPSPVPHTSALHERPAAVLPKHSKWREATQQATLLPWLHTCADKPQRGACRAHTLPSRTAWEPAVQLPSCGHPVWRQGPPSTNSRCSHAVLPAALLSFWTLWRLLALLFGCDSCCSCVFAGSCCTQRL
jgi:hypothetical protein